MAWMALLRLSARSINRRFFQSVLLVLGVAVGVAVVVAIDLANNSASRAFALSSESLTGKATHQIIGGAAGLPSEVYTRLRTELGLRDSAPVVTQTVRAPELGDQPLRLMGIDPFAEPPFRSYFEDVSVVGQGTDGAFEALTDFIATPGTGVLSGPLAARFGLALGDTITLQTPTRSASLRVVGLLSPSNRASQQALDDLILTDIATAQEVSGLEGRLSHIDLILTSSDDMARIEAILPPGARLEAVRADNALEQMTAAFEINLQALSLLAVVVGVFLIYNTVSFSVVQRRPTIGTLRALGATRQQIFLLILGEVALLAFVGTVLGLGLGVIFGRFTVGLVAQTISDLYFTVNVSAVTLDPFTLAKGAALGIAASLGAAALPSWSATHTPPTGSLRRSLLEERTRALLPALTIGGGLFVLAGAGLLLLPSDSLILSFAALFCIIFGGALTTPAALIVGMAALTPLTSRLFGVLGRIAPRAVTRSLSRTAIAVAALTIAVSVIVGVSLMIGSFRATVADWLGTTLGADIFISPPLLTANQASVDVDPALREQVAAVPGVARVSASRAVPVPAPDYPDLLPVNLIAVDFEISVNRQFVWSDMRGSLQEELEAGRIMVSEPFAFRRGITPQNNTLRLLTDRGVQTFEVFGVYYDYSTDQGTVIMARSVYDRFYDDRAISSLAVYVEPGADVQAVIDQLQTQTLVGADLDVQSNRDLREGVFEVFERTFTITIALRLLATLVAFIGILSALMSLQLEQMREYGVMRANGMTRRQLWGYTLIQTGLMGGLAGLLALPIGLALAWVLVYVINVRSFGWTMQFTILPNELLTAFLVALVAALLAGLYPAYSLAQISPARAVRSE
jgi:putative ABC transport system permease protein